jgi:YlmC/YmxH family sporulation protein
MEGEPMQFRITDLRYKEIINISDGARFGYVGDAEVDLVNGRVISLIVPGPARFFGLFGRGEDYCFPWDSVKRFGEDIILVECDQRQPVRTPREKRRWF